MDVTIHYVTMKGADNKYVNGAMGFYVNDKEEALKHAERIGGVVLELQAKEVTRES